VSTTRDLFGTWPKKWLSWWTCASGAFATPVFASVGFLWHIAQYWHDDDQVAYQYQ
jgi:hypothetical protein